MNNQNNSTKSEDNQECKCSLRTRLVGDGCSICNPGLAEEFEQDYRDSVREYFRDDLVFSINDIYFNNVHWHEVAEYFTHE